MVDKNIFTGVEEMKKCKEHLIGTYCIADGMGYEHGDIFNSSEINKGEVNYHLIGIFNYCPVCGIKLKWKLRKSKDGVGSYWYYKNVEFHFN